MAPQTESGVPQTALTEPADLKKSIRDHIVTSLGNDYEPPRNDTYFFGLAYSVRDILIRRWIQNQRSFYDLEKKRVYYLSMEFLPGRFLMNYITNLELEGLCRQTLEQDGISLDELAEQEHDAGLGNGGLGRLASCFMDSMATMGIPAYGYGIRYDYGIFSQKIVDGYQVEDADNWTRLGIPWEIKRRGFLNEAHFYGTSRAFHDDQGRLRYTWTDSREIDALACDILIPGYGGNNVNNLRLWSAVSSTGFDLSDFNRGDYMQAMEEKVLSENISKVLYPQDESFQGKQLRLKQQYFFVAATFQDIIRRFLKTGKPWRSMPDLVAVQLNDTHPAVAVAELMRILLDGHRLDWTEAWDICVGVFAYTNHTVLPEALEVWLVESFRAVLPRHTEIIFEINRRFIEKLERTPGGKELIPQVTIVEGHGDSARIHMARLAVVGSHRVNGVAALHTRILKERVFNAFDQLFPGRIINITNGITPRRWLLQINPGLAGLINDVIGSGWILRLEELRKLVPLAENDSFRPKWQAVKKENKNRLAAYIHENLDISVDPNSMFDIQVKRIHEYKRQMLNILHVIYLYDRLQSDPDWNCVPRTVMLGGKAAPGYHAAKLIIKLVNSVAERINNDPKTNGKLKLIFLPNYCVSLAELVIPAADLSQQISTAGLEASGTGNMKFALNGALTIGTLDGANIEIREEVGDDNIFIFGLTADEIEQRKMNGYNPRDVYENDPNVKTVVDLLYSSDFSGGQPGLFAPLADALLNDDPYFVLADFTAYLAAQQKAEEFYRDQSAWTRMSILNTANMGKFSSDRSISEYAEKVWDIKR